MIQAAKLIKALPAASPVWLTAMVEVMPRFGILGNMRESAFLGQMHHECMGFTRFEENLNYKDPERIARIFRRAFDLDRDKVVDPEEIEFAKNYVRNPQKLANRAYANKFGNGDEASGDGWKFRGRGPIQTTFHDNYLAASPWCGVDLVKTPDELLVPRHGCAAACGYWKSHGCNELADAGEHTKITREINPGMAGLEERILLVGKMRHVIDSP
jgi:putative chitinase